ncbi:hypothetical protein NW739_06205 [Mycoplasmopsis felis]|nr:hypothetical protein [Mycoplasmopsis felis]MCU9940243.1 hypothetical protein [Mycoplasmopsis felis]UWV85509.1 hypothetical protein NW066_02325 [Mycoplasmopsis felis]
MLKNISNDDSLIVSKFKSVSIFEIKFLKINTNFSLSLINFL